MKPIAAKIVRGFIVALIVFCAVLSVVVAPALPVRAADCPIGPNNSTVNNCCPNESDIYVSIELNYTGTDPKSGKPRGAGHCITNNSANNPALSQNPIFIWSVNIISFMSAGVGIGATAGFVYGAILYIYAQGNPGQVKKAIGVMVNSGLSVVMFAMLFSVANFIIPGGVIT